MFEPADDPDTEDEEGPSAPEDVEVCPMPELDRMDDCSVEGVDEVVIEEEDGVGVIVAIVEVDEFDAMDDVVIMEEDEVDVSEEDGVADPDVLGMETMFCGVLRRPRLPVLRLGSLWAVAELLRRARMEVVRMCLRCMVGGLVVLT